MKDIYKLELEIPLTIYKYKNKAQIIDTTIIQNGNTGGLCITKLVNWMSRCDWIC